jgi:hypothetical protein
MKRKVIIGAVLLVVLAAIFGVLSTAMAKPRTRPTINGVAGRITLFSDQVRDD